MLTLRLKFSTVWNKHIVIPACFLLLAQLQTLFQLRLHCYFPKQTLSMFVSYSNTSNFHKKLKNE